MPDKLITTVELAKAIHRHRTFVSAMKRVGYRPVGYNQHRLADAQAWLKAHPKFSTRQAFPSKWGAKRAKHQFTSISLSLKHALFDSLRQQVATSN